MSRKAVVISIIVVLIAAVVGFFVFNQKEIPVPVVETPKESGPLHKVIGKSVQGRNIDAYTYGNGETHLQFIGGIHGGYEWNSVVLAYQIMDHLDAHPETVPENLTVTIVPSANPDGIFKIIGKEGRFAVADVPSGVSHAPGRFNANQVDLNRNFDCKWQPESTWQNKKVNAGTSAFSEPEAKAIRDLALNNNAAAVVFWHSQSGAVYASQCEKGILPATLALINTYAKASGYKAVQTFDAYVTTGGADDWLASIGIPAMTVELTTHDSIEFEKNLAGVKALLDYYGMIDP